MRRADRSCCSRRASPQAPPRRDGRAYADAIHRISAGSQRWDPVPRNRRASEMRQFIKAKQRNLRALPVIDRGFELQVGELDLAAAPPAPLAHPQVPGAAKPRVKLQALIPERSGVGDLRHRAPEKDGREIGDATGVAQRLQDQTGRLAATRRAAIDTDVGAAAQKCGLRSGLRCDCRREWKCHVSQVSMGGGYLFRRAREAGGSALAAHPLGLPVWTKCPMRYARSYRRRFCSRLFGTSCDVCTKSGSRPLSGNTRTSGEFASASPFSVRSSDASRSRQRARDFSQKICAAILPPLAAANKQPETIALASAAPQSRSARHRLRNVFGEHWTILAISS